MARIINSIGGRGDEHHCGLLKQTGRGDAQLVQRCGEGRPRCAWLARSLRQRERQRRGKRRRGGEGAHSWLGSNPDGRVCFPRPELIGIGNPLQSVEMLHPHRRGRSLSGAEILVADGEHRSV